MNPVREGSGWEHLLEIARIEGLSSAFTWNPAVGCSNVDCEVRRRGKCWAMMMAKRFGFDFEPHLIPERLDEPRMLKKPAVITPVSMGDLFGLKESDIKAILDVINDCKRHVFAILTKLPDVGIKFSPYPKNVWFGVTVNSQNDVWRLDILQKISARRKYCVFEPLYSPIHYPLSWLDLVVIGPQNYPLVQPQKSWVESVIENAKGTRIFYKSKLKVDEGGDECGK